MNHEKLEKNAKKLKPCNHSGHLTVSYDGNKHYWCVKNRDVFNWSPISKELFDLLLDEHADSFLTGN